MDKLISRMRVILCAVLVASSHRGEFENSGRKKNAVEHVGKILRKRRLNSGVTKRDAFTMQLRLDIRRLYFVCGYCRNVCYLIFYSTYICTYLARKIVFCMRIIARASRAVKKKKKKTHLDFDTPGDDGLNQFLF